MTRQFNKQTQDELATVSFSYIVLVTRADNSRSCYGPMSYAAASKVRCKMAKDNSMVEVIYLTQVQR